MTKNRSFVTDAISVLQSNVTGLVFTVFTGVVVARVLGPEGKGVISYLMVYPGLVISLADMGIRQSTVVFTGNKTYELQEIVRAISSLYLITSTLCMCLSTGLLLVSMPPAVTVLMVALCVFIVPLRLFQSYFRGLLLGKQEVVNYNRFLWVPVVLTALLTFLFVYLLDLGIVGALAAPVVSLFPVVVAGLWFLVKRYSLKPSFDFEIMRRMTSMGVLFAVSLFVRSLGQRIPIIVMGHQVGVQQIGLFSIGVAFSEMLSQIPKAIGIIVFSRSANAKDSHQFSRSVGEIFRVSILIGLIGGLGLFFVCDFIVNLFYGEAFNESSRVIQIMIPGVVAMCGFRMLVMDLAGRGKPMISLWVAMPALVLNLFLCYLFVGDYGATGAAAALSISNVAVALGFLFIYGRYTGTNVLELITYRKTDFRFISVLYTKMLGFAR